MMFFAYGASRTLPHFLEEAVAAASSCRRLNPALQIAIVSNNVTVDRRIFTYHIQPRADLLFAGDTDNGGQNRNDNLPRQWLTRLFYLAHSPFKITWALDSNVACCTELSASAFLAGAMKTGLWGYDIAHASQRDGALWPHNFNMVYRWNRVTSSLMRDWFLLQLQRGVATDDQKTLLIAELRLRAMAEQIRTGVLPGQRQPLNIAQIATPFATAFLLVTSKASNETECTPCNNVYLPSFPLTDRIIRFIIAGSQRQRFADHAFDTRPCARAPHEKHLSVRHHQSGR